MKTLIKSFANPYFSLLIIVIMSTQANDQIPEKRKPGNPKSKEFLAEMRKKAAAKLAEKKKIREAEKIMAQQEHARKLKEAEKLLNPTPEDHDDVQPSEPSPSKPIKKSKKKKPETESESESGSEPETPKKPTKKDKTQPNYKQEYYRTKLSMLQGAQAPPTKKPEAHPYDLARHDIKQYVNHEVLDNIWNHYYSDTKSPFC
jgi:Mg-chelatase subunit ChlI